MKKLGKIIGILILIIGVLVLVGYLTFNEKRPPVSASPEADSLAVKMLNAVNKRAWDSTHIVTWNFKGGHTYVWDKKSNFVSITWEDYEALLNLQTWKKGRALKGKQEIKGAELDVIRGKAWKYFCNDSFWLIAPFKVFDEGTSRSLVKNAVGTNDLLVSYSSGGVTPGDAYLWKIDKNGLPQSYKMWVSIIPIGGVEATWENWIKQPSGALIATNHQLGPLNIPILSLKTGETLEEIGLSKDFFDKIR